MITNTLSLTALEFSRNVFRAIPDIIGTSKIPSSFVQPSNYTTTIQNIIMMVLFVASVACVGFIMYGGIMYIMSAGDPGKTKLAMSTVTNAIIGLVLAFLAYLITTLVVNALGLQVPDAIGV